MELITDCQLHEQQAAWADKLALEHDAGSYAHSIVEILSGDPPDTVLLSYAAGWHGYFGGSVRRWEEDGRKFAHVSVYT